MSRYCPIARRFTLAGLVLLLVAGCQGLDRQLQRSLPLEDFGKKRQDRSQQILHDFEARRDAAEFEAAQAQWQSGDWAGCREGLDKLLLRNPAHGESRLLAAEIAVAEGRHDEAKAHLAVLLQGNPSDAETHYTAAMLLDAMHCTAEARHHLERARQLDPGNALYSETAGLATALEELPPGAPQAVAAVAERSGTQPAVERLPATDAGGAAILLAADPGDGPGGEVQQLAFREADSAGGAAVGPERAETSPQPLIVPTEPLRPLAADSVTALLETGDAALASGDRETALACFLQAASHRPDDPQVLVSGAVAALRHQCPDVAVALLQPAAERFPNAATIFRSLGAAYYRQGDYPAARTALAQAIALDKTSALTYFLMGCTSAKLGDPQNAATHYRQAALLDPRYSVQR